MWSADRIRESYLNAENRKSQVGILAELNDCSKQEIEEILISEGVMEPKRIKLEKPEKPVEEKPIVAAVHIPKTILDMVEAKLDELEESLSQLEVMKKDLEAQYKELCDFVERS